MRYNLFLSVVLHLLTRVCCCALREQVVVLSQCMRKHYIRLVNERCHATVRSCRDGLSYVSLVSALRERKNVRSVTIMPRSVDPVMVWQVMLGCCNLETLRLCVARDDTLEALAKGLESGLLPRLRKLLLSVECSEKAMVGALAMAPVRIRVLHLEVANGIANWMKAVVEGLAAGALPFLEELVIDGIFTQPEHVASSLALGGFNGLHNLRVMLFRGPFRENILTLLADQIREGGFPVLNELQVAKHSMFSDTFSDESTTYLLEAVEQAVSLHSVSVDGEVLYEVE